MVDPIVRSYKIGYIFYYHRFVILGTLSSLEYEKNEKLANKHLTALRLNDRSN